MSSKWEKIFLSLLLKSTFTLCTRFRRKKRQSHPFRPVECLGTINRISLQMLRVKYLMIILYLNFIRKWRWYLRLTGKIIIGEPSKLRMSLHYLRITEPQTPNQDIKTCPKAHSSYPNQLKAPKLSLDPIQSDSSEKSSIDAFPNWQAYYQ